MKISSNKELKTKERCINMNFAVKNMRTGEIMESGFTYSEAKSVLAQYKEMEREDKKAPTFWQQTHETMIGPYEIVQR